MTPDAPLADEAVVSPSRRVAVQLQGASKHYGNGRSKVKILDGLDMTVTQGNIYGLLGASGCGKTTLLSCICGLRQLDDGDITVLGRRPGEKGCGVPGHRVGYMPQELSLLQEFTISNAMTYFGWLFGMSGDELEDRASFLIDLLQLNSKRNQQIKHLSGGQQRRVSFAAALLHDAELLILDEPTVGLDPELRQSIWDYLIHITEKENKTVIITTHYIEEAKQAHMIGLMRKGQLLAQGTPSKLLTSHGTDSLEEVFLKLSQRQDDGFIPDSFKAKKTDEDELQDFKMMDSSFEEPPGKGMSSPWSLFVGKWKALLMKNLLQIARNLGGLSFSLAFPVMTMGLLFLAVGRDPKELSLAIVNEEILSQSSVNCLGYEPNGCNYTMLSCRYLMGIHLENSIKDMYFLDKESAVDAVRKGNAWGAMIIPANFSSVIELRRDYGDDLEGDIISAGEISVYLDLSNSVIGLMLQRKIQKVFQDFLQDVYVDCNYSPRLGQTPIKFNDPVFGERETSYLAFLAPGAINSIMQFAVVGMTAITMVKEKEEGLWNRLMVAGVTPWEILISHVLTNVMLISAQTAEVLLLALAIIGLECKGSVVLVGAHVFLHGVIGMAFGLVVSLICRNVEEANYLSTGSFYSYMLISGIFWPLEGLPWFMAYFSRMLPLSMASESLRNIMNKGWGLSMPAVYLGFCAAITWIIIFLICSFLILKFRKS